MKTILLGKAGNQPFDIEQQGVSREHASITIDDDGQWTISDLDSSNGTFIRNEHGDWERVAKKKITPDTFICLGPDNANGCKFFAHHVEYPNDYSSDFNYLEDWAQDIGDQLEKAEQKAKVIRKVIALVSGIALIGSFVVPGDDIRMLLLRVGSLVSMVSTLFFDPAKDKKRIKSLRDKLFDCPNPACSHSLSKKEVDNRRCSKCKAQG